MIITFEVEINCKPTFVVDEIAEVIKEHMDAHGGCKVKYTYEY